MQNKLTNDEKRAVKEEKRAAKYKLAMESFVSCKEWYRDAPMESQLQSLIWDFDQWRKVTIKRDIGEE